MPRQAALNKGLILDDETQRQLLAEQTYCHLAGVGQGLVWPPEPLRSVFVREFPRTSSCDSCPASSSALSRAAPCSPLCKLLGLQVGMLWSGIMVQCTEDSSQFTTWAVSTKQPDLGCIIVRTVGLHVHAVRLSQLGVARFARKYPAVMDTLLRTMLEVICKYQRLISGCAPARRTHR